MKLLEAIEYLGNKPDRKVQARNLYNTVSTAFQNNGLSLFSSTRMAYQGQDKKK